MKRNPGVVVVVVAALLGGLAFSQSPKVQDPAGQRLDKAELDLAATRLRVEALSAEVSETKKLLEATLIYLDAQAKSAAEMAATLDESEKAGFTYGINPESRHIMLRGWRQQLATAQKDVPVGPPPPPELPPAKGTRQ